MEILQKQPQKTLVPLQLNRPWTCISPRRANKHMLKSTTEILEGSVEYV